MAKTTKLGEKGKTADAQKSRKIKIPAAKAAPYFFSPGEVALKEAHTLIPPQSRWVCTPSARIRGTGEIEGNAGTGKIWKGVEFCRTVKNEKNTHNAGTGRSEKKGQHDECAKNTKTVKIAETEKIKENSENGKKKKKCAHFQLACFHDFCGFISWKPKGSKDKPEKKRKIRDPGEACGPGWKGDNHTTSEKTRNLHRGVKTAKNGETAENGKTGTCVEIGGNTPPGVSGKKDRKASPVPHRHSPALLLGAGGMAFLFAAALGGCSDSVPALGDARIMPVFEFTAGTPHPRMLAYLLVRPTSDVNRIQSLTLEQSTTGYRWLVTQTASMTVRDSAWVTGAPLAPESPAGFEEGDYRVVYTDSSDRVARIAVTLNYVPDYLESTTETFQELMPSNATAKLAVYDVEGKMLYFGAQSENVLDDEEVKRRYPGAFSWRTIVSPPNNAVAVLLPMHYAEIQVLPQEITEDLQAPQEADEPPDLGDSAAATDSEPAEEEDTAAEPEGNEAGETVGEPAAEGDAARTDEAGAA